MSICENVILAFSILCDRPLLYLLGRMPENCLPHHPETEPPRSLTAILEPLLEALCLSLHQSSSFSYCCSSATEAASFESYTPNTQC